MSLSLSLPSLFFMCGVEEVVSVSEFLIFPLLPSETLSLSPSLFPVHRIGSTDAYKRRSFCYCFSVFVTIIWFYPPPPPSFSQLFSFSFLLFKPFSNVFFFITAHQHTQTFLISLFPSSFARCVAFVLVLLSFFHAPLPLSLSLLVHWRALTSLTSLSLSTCLSFILRRKK